jgi:hypothetical protein
MRRRARHTRRALVPTGHLLRSKTGDIGRIIAYKTKDEGRTTTGDWRKMNDERRTTNDD